MLLVVGLGNPGAQYAAHRHNVGFMVIDRLAAQHGEPFRSKFAGELSRLHLEGEQPDLLLLKPLTYMNRSGSSVQPCASFFKLPPSRLIVIHDELDLPLGTVRLKRGGGHAGHNGLRDIIAHLGPDFYRVRIGIGRPPAGFTGEMADYVLSPFTAEARELLPKYLKQAAQVVLDIAARGFDAAMKRANTRPKKPKPQPPRPADDAPSASASPLAAETNAVEPDASPAQGPGAASDGSSGG
jgi:PTH1 family peptidyl-tRNA hydrolase